MSAAVPDPDDAVAKHVSEALALYRPSVEQVRIVLAEIDRGGDVRSVSATARTWLGNLVAFYDHIERLHR